MVGMRIGNRGMRHTPCKTDSQPSAHVVIGTVLHDSLHTIPSVAEAVAVATEMAARRMEESWSFILASLLVGEWDSF